VEDRSLSRALMSLCHDEEARRADEGSAFSPCQHESGRLFARTEEPLNVWSALVKHP